jgi:orotate phosphoribosyltransferase
MDIYGKKKKDFIQFIIDEEILEFGDFTLKSGRKSPYFFNAGLFNDGFKLDKLASAYIDTFNKNFIKPNLLFGSAYKAIPLVTSISQCFYHKYSYDIKYCFNRKEIKDHGDKGLIVGSKIKGDTWIVDDVITSGMSIDEAYSIIKQQGGNPVGVIIILDRQEVSSSNPNRSIIDDISDKLDIPIIPIITLDDIIEHLSDVVDEYCLEIKQTLLNYRNNNCI